MSILRNRLSLLVTLSCLSLLGAVGWQGIYGQRNVEFRSHLGAKASAAEAELAAVVASRIALEHRVSMLRPGTVDADLVDELARRDLDFGGKRDLVARIQQ